MKIFKLCLSLLMAALLPAGVCSAAEIRVKVNERTIVSDVSPYIFGGYTMVPVRFVAEAFDCDKIEWREAEKSVELVDGENHIRLNIGSDTAYVNEAAVEISTPAAIKNNRTYVPIRFVSENMGATVLWDAENSTVNIYRNGVVKELSYSEDELYWLARIIHAEAEGEPFEGKVAVGNVILNRVRDENFPNTIYGVIFDRKNDVQFTPVANGAIYNEPSNECYYAADRALTNNNTAGEALFFLNPVISTNTWIIDNRSFYTSIGGHDFYL